MIFRIQPRKERRSNGVYWVVSLGKKHTGGRRLRRYFGTRKEANNFIAKSAQDCQQLGREAFVLPLKFRMETLTCLQRLEPFKATLSQAVEGYIRNLPRPEALPNLNVLKDEFLKSRKAMNCRPRTLVQYESYLNVICLEFGKTEVSKLCRQDIEDWLEESDWSPRTRKNYLVTMTTVMNYALGKGYCAGNTAASIDRPILDDRPVGILTPSQAEKLLRVAKSSAPDMLPALVIALFAGLRRSEIYALDWAEIDPEGGTIEVKGIKAKTRQRRLVSLSHNLTAWLDLVRDKVGRVCTDQSIDVFSERLRRLAVTAEIAQWPHNAMRHSFGSYFLGKTKDENLTASEMSNSPAVVIKHYRALVRDSDVSKYWNLSPVNV